MMSEACIPVAVLCEHGYRWEQRFDNPAYRTAACQNPHCRWQEDVQSGVTSWRQYLAHLVALAPAQDTADPLPAAVVALLRDYQTLVLHQAEPELTNFSVERDRDAFQLSNRIDALLAGRPDAEAGQ